MSKIKLSNSDWEILFATKIIFLGNQKIEIKPLSVEKVFKLITILGGFEDVEVDVLFTSDNIVRFKQEIGYFLSDHINVEEEDILNLPASKILEIIDAIVDIDRDLLGNFSSLMEKVKKMDKKVLKEDKNIKKKI